MAVLIAMAVMAVVWSVIRYVADARAPASDCCCRCSAAALLLGIHFCQVKAAILGLSLTGTLLLLLLLLLLLHWVLTGQGSNSGTVANACAAADGHAAVVDATDRGG
jgi:hypothetical protein